MGFFTRLFSGKPKVMPTHLDVRNFDAEVINGAMPYVVDFWGPGCPPCQQLETVIVNLATDYAGKVKFGEVNVHEAMEIAQRFNVMATPTVLYFKNGEVVERVAGFRGSLFHREIIDEDLLAE
jgi:thioredoxin 1